jgi:hypothetical protein
MPVKCLRRGSSRIKRGFYHGKIGIENWLFFIEANALPSGSSITNNQCSMLNVQ